MRRLYVGLSLFILLPICFAQKPEKKEDPQVKAIEKEMEKVAKKALPVHFKMKIISKTPIGDEMLTAKGEVWAVGDKKLNFKIRVKPGRLMEITNQIIINEKGAWIRMVPGEVIFCDIELIKKLEKLQKGKVKIFQMASVMENINILSGLKSQGFKLKWRGQKKVGGVIVDEIIGTKIKSETENNDSFGENIDKCIILIGEKDRVPRKMEFFSGNERVRLMEFYDIEVGKKIDDSVFQFSPKENEKIVPAQKHPMWGPIIENALKALKEKNNE